MRALIALILIISSLGTSASSPTQAAESFLQEALGHPIPAPRVLWLTDELQAAASQALGHPPEVLRIKFWQDQGRRAWILDEIGKEQPITAGFVVSNGRIEFARVLVFRESRGGEIQMPGFTRQFQNVVLQDGGELDRHIDGITGATLSVNAMQRMAKLALRLDQQISQSPPP